LLQVALFPIDFYYSVTETVVRLMRHGCGCDKRKEQMESKGDNPFGATRCPNRKARGFQQRRLLLLTVLLCVTACVVQTAVHAQQSSADEHRNYADGPLTAKDFRAPIPGFVKFRGQTALTTTDLLYDLKYRLFRSQGRTTARLSSISFQAVVIPSQSWNRIPEHVRLMDHEQGHFDLTYIASLRARSGFPASRRLTGSGANDEQAIKELRQRVADRFRPFTEKLRAAHIEYDEITRHGAALGPQKEQRQRQKQQIEELTEGRKSKSQHD
jgi:hypothetical protein